MAAKKSLRRLDRKDLDDEFEKFMNEPISDDSRSATSPVQRKGHKLEHSETLESMKMSDEFSMLDTKSFDKSPSPVDRTPFGHIPEEIDVLSNDEDEPLYPNDHQAKSVVKEEDAIGISRDSLEMGRLAESYSAIDTAKSEDTVAAVRNYAEQALQGMDTLEENADKERFFRNLLAETSGTLDFSKLNKALDETHSDKETSDDFGATQPEITSTARYEPVASIDSNRNSEIPTIDNVLAPKPTSETAKESIEKDAGMKFLERVALMESLGSTSNIQSRLVSGAVSSEPDVLNSSKQRSESPLKEADISYDDFAQRNNDYENAENSQNPQVPDYDSESPPSESLRSIKEIAKARIEEAKERRKDSDNSYGKKTSESSYDSSKSHKIKSVHKKPPRELKKSSSGKNEKPSKLPMSKELRKRTPKGSSSSANSSRKGSINDSNKHFNVSSNDSLRFSVGQRSHQLSNDFRRLPNSDKDLGDERELLTSKTSDFTREHQLQTELYELRAEFNKVLDENENLLTELDRAKRGQDENEIKLRYEFEVEQLQQKIVILEKQLKKSKELRIRRDSDEEVGKEVPRELERLQKELKEQELLLNGYQLENERLFQEMKRKDTERKQFQSSLVDENQRLKSTVAELEMKREQLANKVKELQREKEEAILCKDRDNENREHNEFTERLKSVENENTVQRRELLAFKEKAEKDAKLIKDLERQRDEMEKIINRRYPDNVPNLLQEKSKTSFREEIDIEKSRTINFLEGKVKRLERELDGKDEETRTRLLAGESRYKEMAMVYEEHISNLQTQLSEVTMRWKKEMRHRENRQKDARSDDDRNEFELEKKREEISRKEKKKKRQNRSKETHEDNDSFIQSTALATDRLPSPAIVHENFSKIQELQKENMNLKDVIENVRMEFEEQRVKHSAEMASVEAELNKIRSNAISEIEDMTLTHRKHIDAFTNEKQQFEMLIQSLRIDNSKLESKATDQEMIIEKLKEKILESTVDKQLLQASKVKEEMLQSQIKLLKKQLEEALECQPLDQNRFRHLEMKIASMQQRHVDREGELQKLLRRTQPRQDLGGEEAGLPWREIVESKNKQIGQFREELDSILEVLKHLLDKEKLPMQKSVVR